MAKGDSSPRQQIGPSGTVGTTNVAQCLRATERACSRPAHLPGITGFYGQPGLGKSKGAAVAAMQYDAYYIECRDSWRRTDFLDALLNEMRIKPSSTISKKTVQAAEQLAHAQQRAEGPKPLIIDEADKPIDKGYIELIRDIYEGSGGAPMVLIGEENMEIKLRQWDRMHSRVLQWFPAQPSSFEDARALASLSAPGLKLADDLLEHVRRVTGGIARIIDINLSNIAEEFALNPAADGIASAAWWGNRELYIGHARRGVQ